MELFRPEIKGDTLFFDLDTVIVGDLSTVASVGRTTLLSDMGNADLIARKAANSSVMYLTESDRAQVWERWIADPNGHMARYGELGDQAIDRRGAIRMRSMAGRAAGSPPLLQDWRFSRRNRAGRLRSCLLSR